MRRPLILATVTLAVGGALIAVPAAPPAASIDLPVVQEAHFAVIDEIARWDAQAPVSRIGAIEGDPIAGTIEIGWVGDVPSELEAMAASAAIRDIDVSFVEQEASGAELTELAHDLAASMPVDGAFSIGIGADGLSVEVPSEAAAIAAGTEPIPLEGEVLDVIAATEDAAASLGASVSVEETDTVPSSTAARPLEVGSPVAEGAITPIVTGRSNDTSVLSGGMRVQTQFRTGAFVGCTSGFSAFHGHRPVIVTAAHCSDYADDRAVRNVAGASIGRSDLVAELNDGARSYDLGVIDASYDARTLPRIYTGETTTVNITGTQVTYPPAGYRLCSSGQVTGWKCDLTAGEAYVTCYGTPRGSECMDVQIVRSSGTSAFCLGDSGGPVVSMPTASGAMAVGVVSGLKTRVAASCSKEGLIAPLSQLLATVPGLQLHTAPGGSCDTQCAQGQAAAVSILDRINRERASANLAPLTQDACLAEMADGWAGAMAAGSMTGSVHNPSLTTEARACSLSTWGENVGRTGGASADPAAIMSAWMASSGHRANILKSTFTHVGVGVERGSNGYWYYVLDFGRR